MIKRTGQLESITTRDTINTRLGTPGVRARAPAADKVQRLEDRLDFVRGGEAFLISSRGASVNCIRTAPLSVAVEENQVL